jgi:hypothetical protein
LTRDIFTVALQCDADLSSQNFGYAINPTNTPRAVLGRTALHQNVPNPFNPRTTIAFELVRSGRVEVTIHDVTGRVIRHLVHDVRPAGVHEVVWDGCDDRGERVASGLYHYSLQTDQGRWVKRMVLLK